MCTDSGRTDRGHLRLPSCTKRFIAIIYMAITLFYKSSSNDLLNPGGAVDMARGKSAYSESKRI